MPDTTMMSKDGMDEMGCSSYIREKRIHALPLRILNWQSNLATIILAADCMPAVCRMTNAAIG